MGFVEFKREAGNELDEKLTEVCCFLQDPGRGGYEEYDKATEGDCGGLSERVSESEGRCGLVCDGWGRAAAAAAYNMEMSKVSNPLG